MTASQADSLPQIARQAAMRRAAVPSGSRLSIRLITAISGAYFASAAFALSQIS